MAYCVKCGREIEGGSLCASCGAQPRAPIQDVPRTENIMRKDAAFLNVSLIFMIICAALVLLNAVLGAMSLGSLNTYIMSDSITEEQLAAVVFILLGAVGALGLILFAIGFGIPAMILNRKATSLNSLSKRDRRSNAIKMFVFAALFALIVYINFIFQIYAGMGATMYKAAALVGVVIEPLSDNVLTMATANMVMQLVSFGMAIVIMVLSLIYMLRACIRKMSD